VENVKRDRLRCLRRSDLRRNQGTLARRFRSQRYRQVSVSISKRRVLRSKFVLYRRWQVSVNFLLATEVHSLKRNYKNSTAFLIFMHYYIFRHILNVRFVSTVPFLFLVVFLSIIYWIYSTIVYSTGICLFASV